MNGASTPIGGRAGSADGQLELTARKYVAARSGVPQDHGMDDMLDRVLPRIGGTETLDRLAALSGSDFTSVMLEVARRRAARETPASARRRYEGGGVAGPGQGAAPPLPPG